MCAPQGLYPQSVAFRVYCDPPGGRVGSGGGTLVALMALLREEAPELAAASDADTLSRGVAAFFSSRRVLLLHAGGESRRLPCYVPEGKLFAPLALPSASAFTPVVLDVLLSLYFRYPWSEGELILASGDVIVDFDTATLPAGFARGDLCGFGKPTSLQQGCRHGVFVFGEADGPGGPGGPTSPVTGFLQKASPETLRLQALLPAGAGGLAEACAVDTGIFSMSPGFVAALLGWAAAPVAAPMPLTKGGEGGEGGVAASPLEATEAGRLYFDFYLEVPSATPPYHATHPRHAATPFTAPHTLDQVASAMLPAPLTDYLEAMARGASCLPPPLLESLHGALRHLERALRRPGQARRCGRPLHGARPARGDGVRRAPPHRGASVRAGALATAGGTHCARSERPALSGPARPLHARRSCCTPCTM